MKANCKIEANENVWRTLYKVRHIIELRTIYSQILKVKIISKLAGIDYYFYYYSLNFCK